MARKRRPTQSSSAADASRAPIDPDLALFAARVRAEQDRQRSEKRAAREERQKVEEHQRLVAAKDEAAAELKRLRRRDRPSGDEVDRAEAAYRAALAALLTHETGQAPSWAPTVAEPADEPAVELGDPTADDEPGPEPGVEPQPEPEPGPADEPGS